MTIVFYEISYKGLMLRMIVHKSFLYAVQARCLILRVFVLLYARFYGLRLNSVKIMELICHLKPPLN